MTVDGDELMALWAPLCGYVRARMQGRDNAEIEDIAGEAIVRTLAADRELDDRPHALRSWLYTVAQRLVIDWRRRQRVRVTIDLDAVDTERGRINVGGDRHAATLDVRAVLGGLKEASWAVPWALAVEGRSAREVGVLRGISASAVKSQACRDRARLRVILEAV